ncbi:unnamed protein product, partial [Musa textilis]
LSTPSWGAPPLGVHDCLPPLGRTPSWGARRDTPTGVITVTSMRIHPAYPLWALGVT